MVGSFNGHVEVGLVAFECLDDLLALRRSDVVGNEDLVAELADGDLLASGEGMGWADDELEFVAVDDDGADLGVVGRKETTPISTEWERDVIWDATGELPADGDLDAGVLAAVFVENGQEIQTGVLVCGQGELATMELAKFGESAFGVAAED